MQSTVLEDTWVDGVIHRPSLSHSAKECSQHPRPLPASPQPPPPAVQIGQISAYQVRALKQG